MNNRNEDEMETDGDFYEEEITSQDSNENKSSTIISQSQKLGTTGKPIQLNEESFQSLTNIQEQGKKGPEP